MPEPSPDYQLFAAMFGPNIPEDWPIRIQDKKLVVPREHNGTSLRDAIIARVNRNSWVSTKIEQLLDRITPNAFVDQVLEELTRIVDKANEEAVRICASGTPKDGPEILLAKPEPTNSFPYHLRHQVIKFHLEAAGAKTSTVKAYDTITNAREIWVRDRYVLAPDGTAILQAAESKSGESRTHADMVNALKKEFAARGIPTQQTSSRIEGGDVLQHPQSNTVFIGVSAPKGVVDKEAEAEAKILAKALGMKLKIIPRTNGAYYHLDTLMSVLPDGALIVMPFATNAQGMKAIRETIPKENLLEIPRADPLETLALNLVTVNGHVFTPKLLPQVEKFLKARGFHPHEGFYETLDSAIHCQVNFLKRRKPDGKSDVALNMPADAPQLELPWQETKTTPLAPTPASAVTKQTGKHGLG